jgi:hypothetical protein
VASLCNFRHRGISKPARLAELGQTQAVLKDPSWGMMGDWGRPRPNWIRQAIAGDLVLSVAYGMVPVVLLTGAVEGCHFQVGLVLTVGNVLAGVVGR